MGLLKAFSFLFVLVSVSRAEAAGFGCGDEDDCQTWTFGHKVSLWERCWPIPCAVLYHEGSMVICHHAVMLSILAFIDAAAFLSHTFPLSSLAPLLSIHPKVINPLAVHR